MLLGHARSTFYSHKTKNTEGLFPFFDRSSFFISIVVIISPPPPPPPFYQLEMEWMFSVDDNLGPPGDPRRRFTLPMDLVFDKVCALLHKLAGRTQLSLPAKNASATAAGARASSGGPATAGGAAGAAAATSGDGGGADRGRNVTRDVLLESLVRHKKLAFRLVLSCLAPVLAGSAGLAAMTEGDIIAAENKCRLEEGGADMLGRPPESFREAVLPEYLRHKAQFEYKVGGGVGRSFGQLGWLLYFLCW